MATATQEPGTKVLRRRQGLALYLGAVEAAIAAGPGNCVRLPHAGTEPLVVTLDPWAVEWIRSSSVAPKDPPELRELLLQCLAFLAKGTAGVARLSQEEPRAGAPFYAAQAELMLDSAVGMALQREAQKAVDDLVRLGALADSKMLLKLQKRLRSVVNELKLSLAESNRGRDEALVEHLTEEAGRPTAFPAIEVEAPAEMAAPARKASPTAAKRARPATVSPRPRLRTGILLFLVGVAILVVLVSRAVPSLTRRQVHVVSRGDFAASAPLLSILAPPPSAYAVVDSEVWASYDEGQKRRMVDAMGGVLDLRGYWGLLVRTPDGTPVARWIVERGSSLLHDAPVLRTGESDAREHFERFVP